MHVHAKCGLNGAASVAARRSNQVNQSIANQFAVNQSNLSFCLLTGNPCLQQSLDPLLHKRSAHCGQVFTVRGWPVSKQNNTSLLMLCLLCWLLRGRRLNLHSVPLSVQIQIGNSAIGGITSSTAAQCFDAMVNPTSDLVLIEFSLNDR